MQAGDTEDGVADAVAFETAVAQEGRYELRDVDTDEVLLNRTLQTSIWWLPAPSAKEDDEPQAARTTSRAGSSSTGGPNRS